MKQLTNSVGAVTREYDYDAFGVEKESEPLLDAEGNEVPDPNPFRYCAEYFDEETGSIYLRARYYDPVVGRFLSQDPIRAGLNWYTYANGNPIVYYDPTGLVGENERNQTGLNAGAKVRNQTVAKNVVQQGTKVKQQKVIQPLVSEPPTTSAPPVVRPKAEYSTRAVTIIETNEYISINVKITIVRNPEKDDAWNDQYSNFTIAGIQRWEGNYGNRPVYVNVQQGGEGNSVAVHLMEDPTNTQGSYASGEAAYEYWSPDSGQFGMYLYNNNPAFKERRCNTYTK